VVVAEDANDSLLEELRLRFEQILKGRLAVFEATPEELGHLPLQDA